MKIEELEGLEVEVEEVMFMAGVEAPDDRPHPFVYYINIVNNSPQEVIILGRKWVIEQENGESIVVEGDGVVGQKPVIPSGGGFEYNSYHFVSEDSVASGAIFGEAEDGRTVYARIPTFKLTVPQWA